MKTVHLLISGKVQGVFFRAEAKTMAEKFAITGWIKNTPDENVEALITGESAHVDKFVNWCKTGPERAKVKNVQVSESPFTRFEKFEVIR